MYTGLDGFGPFDKAEARIYEWRYEYFKAQGKDPGTEIAKEDLEAIRELFFQPIRFIRWLFGGKKVN